MPLYGISPGACTENLIQAGIESLKPDGVSMCICDKMIKMNSVKITIATICIYEELKENYNSWDIFDEHKMKWGASDI